MLFILNVLITMFTYVHDDKQEVNNVLDNLHKYASEANGDEYIKLFNKNAVFHGTDLTERWTIEEFKEYALKRFESGTGWTYEAIERNIFVNSNNTTAWFDEIIINEKYGKFRGTGVLSKVNNIWKIDQYNLLLPIPNDLLLKYTKEIKNYINNN